MGLSRVALAGTCTTATSRASAPFRVAKGPPRLRDCSPCRRAEAGAGWCSRVRHAKGLAERAAGCAWCRASPTTTTTRAGGNALHNQLASQLNQSVWHHHPAAAANAGIPAEIDRVAPTTSAACSPPTRTMRHPPSHPPAQTTQCPWEHPSRCPRKPPWAARQPPAARAPPPHPPPQPQQRWAA